MSSILSTKKNHKKTKLIGQLNLFLRQTCLCFMIQEFVQIADAFLNITPFRWSCNGIQRRFQHLLFAQQHLIFVARHSSQPRRNGIQHSSRMYTIIAQYIDVIILAEHSSFLRVRILWSVGHQME